MDTAFEEAPICDEPSSPIWVMGLDLLEMPLVPLPEITPGMTLKKMWRTACHTAKENHYFILPPTMNYAVSLWKN